MKIASLIARILLGALFVFSGLNGFFHFVPNPPPAPTPAGQFQTLMATSHYLLPVFVLQAVGGLLLLANRFVPIALVLLGPILVNILIFHICLMPEGLAIAIVCVLLWGVIFYQVRGAFAGIFAARV